MQEIGPWRETILVMASIVLAAAIVAIGFLALHFLALRYALPSPMPKVGDFGRLGALMVAWAGLSAVFFGLALARPRARTFIFVSGGSTVLFGPVLFLVSMPKSWQPPPDPPAIATPSIETPTSRERKPELSWNVWVTRNEVPVSAIEPGKAYVAWLDLSRIKYIPNQSVAAAGTVQDAIVQASGNKLQFRVRAVSLSDLIEFEDAATKELPLVISLERLKTPSDSELAQFASLHSQVKAGSRPLSDLVNLASAGMLPVPFRTTTQSGCAQIAFSIWDESGVQPLDNIVITLPVTQHPNSPLQCNAPWIQGGFGSLLGAVTSQERSPFQAALQWVEYKGPGGKPKSLAIFVDASGGASDPKAAKSAQSRVHVWFPETLLSKYMSDSLIAQVRKARSGPDYGPVANSLKLKLFNDPDHQEQSAEALAALVALTRDAQKPLTLLVRAIAADGSFFYPPLSLLAAVGGPLAHRPTVVYPLPRENYARSQCVSGWDVAVPAVLSPVGAISLSKAEMSGPMNRISNLDQLRGYFAGATAAASAPASTGGEGLVLLAHHGRGSLWFEGDGVTGPHIDIEENLKRFRSGSVAILGACSTANPDSDNQLLVEKLNRRGVDAIIASPFPVEPSYGVSLAKAALQVIVAERAAKRSPTLADIFQKATTLVANGPEGKGFSQKGLEFVILGNADIRLCP